MRNQDQLKRNIDDNLNYRRTKAEVDELTREIETLEENVLTIGSMSSLEADLKRHLQEKEGLLSEVKAYFFFFLYLKRWNYFYMLQNFHVCSRMNVYHNCILRDSNVLGSKHRIYLAAPLVKITWRK